MFTATTIVNRVAFVEQEGGDSKPVVQQSETIMGNVQDATAKQLQSGESRGFSFNTIIYYPVRTNVNPDDEIEWVEAGAKYRVVAERQEASFGLLWAVYCTRVG
jgi:hypothetical protein